MDKAVLVIGLLGIATYFIVKNVDDKKPKDMSCVEKLVAMSDIVYLKMSDGRYLCCNASGTIFTDGAKDPETKWSIEKVPNDPTSIRIKNVYHDRYLSSEDNGGVSAADKVSTDEVFVPTCNLSGTVFLKSVQGRYVGNVGPYYDVEASATVPGAAETIVFMSN
jgi:hypothetical protein